jgi:hypothetical protein
MGTFANIVTTIIVMLNKKNLTRRDFLKLIGALGVGVAAIPIIKSVPIPMNVNAKAGITATTTTSNNGLVYSPGENPAGLPMSEWVARWSQWAFAYQDPQSPILDNTGQILQREQPEGQRDMFFLTGGYNVNRRVVIPHTAAIMFPVLNGTWGYSDENKIGKIRDDEHLKSLVRSELNTHSILEATINGQPVPFYRIDSGEPFNMYNEQSVYFRTKEEDKGFTRAFADGYYAFLKPLPIGTYTIYIHGRLEKALVQPPMYDNEVMHFVSVI